MNTPDSSSSDAPVNGLLFVASDVDPADDADFNRWYDTEHVEERVRIPGFLSGARYFSLEGGRKYLGLYRTRSLAVFGSPGYRAAFEKQTPWSVANLDRMRRPIARRGPRASRTVSCSYRSRVVALAGHSSCRRGHGDASFNTNRILNPWTFTATRLPSVSPGVNLHARNAAIAA